MLKRAKEQPGQIQNKNQKSVNITDEIKAEEEAKKKAQVQNNVNAILNTGNQNAMVVFGD